MRWMWSTAWVPEMPSAAACVTASCMVGRWRRRCAMRTPPAPSSRPDSNARPRCRPPRRWPRSPTKPQWRPSMSRSPDFQSALCKDYAEITDLRATDPQAIERAWQGRTSRPTVRGNGRLMIVAADHPARGALAVGSRPTAMNSRTDLLDRLRAALADPGVDGVLATADILDDLVLLGALEDKVVFSSMNRGGLAGAQFELDDRMTAATAAATAAARMNGGKMLCRIDLDDPGTVATLEACARAVDELASHGMIAMVEPFMSTRVDGKVRNDLSPDAVIKSIHIGQGLGSTSAYTWMKLPVVDEMARVMESTTLPTLLLGGDPADPDEAFASWEKALGLPSVRGLIVGRTLLYPADDDVSSAVAAAVSMVRTWASAAAG